MEGLVWNDIMLPLVRPPLFYPSLLSDTFFSFSLLMNLRVSLEDKQERCIDPMFIEWT